MSHQVPRQNYQLGEKVAPAEPRVTTQLGIRGSLCWEAVAEVGGNQREEEKIISEGKKCTLSQSKTLICVTRVPLLGGNRLTIERPWVLSFQGEFVHADTEKQSPG